MSLHLDWCSNAASKYAVEHWHYSRSMPAGKLARVGVWEDGRFIGCVLFGRGSIYRIGSPFGLTQMECVELVRIALSNHNAPVSQIGSVAVRMLKRQAPGLRVIVSFADTRQGHIGGIYQAMNWLYVGSLTHVPEIVLHGKRSHRRSIGARYGTHALGWLQQHVDPLAAFGDTVTKHKYVLPLDDAMREQIAPLAKPYPKRATSIEDAPAIHAGEGGSQPTVALQRSAAD